MGVQESKARGNSLGLIVVALCVCFFWPGGQPAASALVVPRSCLAEATATISFNGSGFLGTRSGHEHGTGTYFACRLADPTIHSGRATFDSDFTFNCSTLQFTDTGTYSIQWNNGRETTISYTARTLLPALAVGHVTSGEFEGQQTVDYDIVVPFSPKICTNTSGSIRGGGVGLLTVGSPPLL